MAKDLWRLCDCPVGQGGRMNKVHVLISYEVKEKIEEYCKSHQITISRFMEVAAQNELRRRKDEERGSRPD